MAIENTYLSIVHLITRNAIIATAVMLLCLSGFSAVAAENFAPEEYKPSQLAQNLFAQNLQPDSNPYTALKGDENNHIASSQECNLSIKYPKQANGFPLKTDSFTWEKVHPELINLTGYEWADTINVFIDQDNSEYRRITESFAKESGAIENQAFQDNRNGKISDEEYKNVRNDRQAKSWALPTHINPVSVQCEKTDYPVIKNYYLKNDKDFSFEPIDQEMLKQMTGWFITEAPLHNIYLDTRPIAGAGQTRIILFEHDTVEYMITVAFENETNKPITANQIQLQFNSLARNDTNKDIIGGEADKNLQGGYETSSQTEFSQNSGENSQSSSNSQDYNLQTRVLTWHGEVNGYTLLREYRPSSKDGSPQPFADYYTPTREEFTNRNTAGGGGAQFKITGKIGPNRKNFLSKLIMSALEISEVQSVEQVGLNTKKGTIKGQLSYPSEYLHPQTVCAKSIITGEKICEYFTERNYSLSVPIGIYHVYSFMDKIEPIEDNKLVYYDKYVTECMINRDEELCNPQEYTQEEVDLLNQVIAVSVAENQTQENINPQDWYGRSRTPRSNNKQSQSQSSQQGSPRNYTNEYYPDLRLNYDSSWQINTETWESNAKNKEGEILLNRRIVLSKNGAHLRFSLNFAGSYGGGGGESVAGVKVSDNVYRYQKADMYTYIFAPNPQGPNFQVGQGYDLNSTMQMENGETAQARVLVEAFAPTTEQVSEVDKIIANSTFWSQ